MTLVLLSNNLGIMWVGIEATTLLTAFLICLHRSRESLEATWKYILICSIGVAFAFMGTLLAAASARGLNLSPHNAMLWTTLRENASLLDPKILKAAFVFLLVGYGTKAGLTPMHTWLPDAHSQAPAPVSALFSGFMLNAALYCVTRYVPIVEAATGRAGWSLHLLIGFGILSIMVSSAFILFQHDLKRLLAYSSVEHLGIIALGIGLGGLGTFAALFHTINHSVCKTLSFFAAGRLGQIYHTHDMSQMSGTVKVSRVWGVGMFGGLLALLGVAPFAIFISEFLILKAALDTRQFAAAILFLLGSSTVFVGALSHAIPLVLGDPKRAGARVRGRALEAGIVGFALLLLLVLGLTMPEYVTAAIEKSADVIRNPISSATGAPVGGAL
jgi:hydrogenase-4 component F